MLAEEFARAKAPMRADFFGDTLVGPTILQWGTEEQKQEFLPKILRGEMRWCQGFSEPNSGSDLASLKTSAVLDGDEWVINGQKVWTTGGHHADYCFLLTRTDPDAPKHKGISYLLVPMRQAGVEVRGITQPDGTAEFCEVFFDDARCPKDNVVGGVNNGWKVANSTLAFERGQSATTGYRRFEEEYRQMVEAATANGAIDDPIIRQRLVRVLDEDPDPALQRAALADGDGAGSSRTPASWRSGRRTRCSGRRCTRRRWSWRSTSSAPTSMLIDTGPGDRVVAGRAARQAPRRLPGQPDDVVVLLLPLGDDLGRHQPDPAQHRRRASARPAEGAATRVGRPQFGTSSAGAGVRTLSTPTAASTRMDGCDLCRIGESGRGSDGCSLQHV